MKPWNITWGEKYETIFNALQNTHAQNKFVKENFELAQIHMNELGYVYQDTSEADYHENMAIKHMDSAYNALNKN